MKYRTGVLCLHIIQIQSNFQVPVSISVISLSIPWWYHSLQTQRVAWRSHRSILLVKFNVSSVFINSLSCIWTKSSDMHFSFIFEFLCGLWQSSLSSSWCVWGSCSCGSLSSPPWWPSSSPVRETCQSKKDTDGGDKGERERDERKLMSYREYQDTAIHKRMEKCLFTGKLHWASKETYHFFRATHIKIQFEWIIIGHRLAIIVNTPYQAHLKKNYVCSSLKRTK